MTDKQQQTIDLAVHFWEIGMLLFLYEKGIITEDEYNGIRRIAIDEYNQRINVF